MKEIKSYKVEIYTTYRILRLRYEWMWKVTASNGKLIGGSSESYVNFKDCEYNVKSLGKSLVEYDE
jgi:uncharacterized protein YegP (UPF0339 family)